MKRKWLPGMMDFMRFRVENPVLRKIFFYPPLVRSGFKGLVIIFRIANLPVIRWFHPWVQPQNTKMFIIPVDKSIVREEDMELPYKVVERMIEKSTHRVIMDFCGCRVGYECKNYPSDVGCLMMGEDAIKIPPAYSRRVSKQEATAHLQKAVEAGLSPFIGKARVDNYIFGIPDNGKLMTVCFCCECCCIARQITGRLPPAERNVQFNRLSGLEVWVDEDLCKGCGICIDKCFLNLIELSNGKARIPDDCRGCGRCAKYCPNGAIRLKLSDPGYLDQAVRAIESAVKP